MSDQEHDPTIGIVTQRQERPKYKTLTIQVPEDTDTSGIEGVAFPADMAEIATAMLRTAHNAARRKEADRVPADSPLACARCKQQRADHCSLCQEQVCGWCHVPAVDHHGGKSKPLHVDAKTYIMTNPETGDIVPHRKPGGDDGDDSLFIREPLPGPCLTCGYDGHVYRLRYRDPDDGAWYKKGVAYEALCYACGAGNGNREPVHQTHTGTQNPALANIPGEG